MITREFNLNLNAGRSTPLVIFANQFNSDEQWVFTLFDDNGQQYIPSSGSIVGIKADGLGIINSATVTAGKVVVDVTEQITASAGISEFELSLDNGTHGTANFKVVVEKKPSEGAEYSDSDISLIQEALDIVNPLPTGGTAGQVLTKTTNGSSWQDAQAGLPSGGTTGQVLTKTASGSAWQNAEKELPTGGSAGQVLTKTASGTTWSSVDAFPSEGTTGQVLTKSNDGVAWTDAGNPTDTQVATAVSDWLDENITPTTPAVDATLTITGAAADAKKTGDEISALKSQITQSTGMSSDFKVALDSFMTAMLTLADNVAYDDDASGDSIYTDIETAKNAAHSAMYPPANLTRIDVTYTPVASIYVGDSLDKLRDDLVVTAVYDNGSSTAVSDYVLSGTLIEGTSVVTATWGGKSATFNVTVGPAHPLYQWDFRQSATDIWQGAEFTINSANAELTADGLYLKAATAGTSKCATAKIPLGGHAVIEFGEMNATTGGAGGNSLFMETLLQFGYRGNSRKFSTYYNNAWHDDVVTNIPSNNRNFFSNKTLEIHISDLGVITFICDGQTVLEVSDRGLSTTGEYVSFGCWNASTFYPAYIKTYTIYGAD